MAQDKKSIWAWGAESRWKFYVVGTILFGIPAVAYGNLAFYYLLRAREAWAYALITVLCIMAAFISSIVMHGVMKMLGFVR